MRELLTRIRWIWDRPGCFWRCSKYRFACPHGSISKAAARSLAMRDRTWNEPFFEKTFHSRGHVCETSRCWSECHPPGCHPSDCCGDPAVHGDPR